MALQRKSTHISSDSYGLLADGSALFFASRQQFPDRNLNYRALERIIAEHVGADTPASPAMLFSSIEPANEKQLKFVEFIEQNLKWSVQRIAPHDATVCNPLLTDGVFRHIRFDAWIAYAIGRLAGKTDRRIVVVSDSWPLNGPIQECASRGTAVTVCFFGGVIDTRWHRVFREQAAAGRIDFLDLDDHSESLFDRAKPTRGKEDYRLSVLD